VDVDTEARADHRERPTRSSVGGSASQYASLGSTSTVAHGSVSTPATVLVRDECGKPDATTITIGPTGATT
jgi:hypothetical protein